MRWICLFVVAGFVSISGCSEGGPVQVDANDGPAMRMSGLGETYDWAISPNEPANREIQAALVATIDEELSKKGFSKAGPSAASFWVETFVIRENKTDSSVYPHGVVYPQGTLIIKLIDPASRRVIWASSGQGKILTNASPDERRQRMREVVGQMLSRMPPK